MSSTETTEAFVFYGDWSTDSDAHPAMGWMHQYTDMFDRQAWDTEDWADWHVDDYVLVKSDGEVIKGGAEAWKALAAIYGPFVKYHHEPYFAITTPTKYGWQMIGQAHVYANLPGQPAAGEPAKVKDGKGREWDAVIPGAFRFEYKKDAGGKKGAGIKLLKTELMSDSAPVVMTLVKRGVIKLG